MAIVERMVLTQHDKTFVDGVTIEHIKYSHIIERDGEVISNKPHRIVLDRINAPDYPMPDGSIKTTAEVIADIA